MVSGPKQQHKPKHSVTCACSRASVWTQATCRGGLPWRQPARACSAVVPWLRFGAGSGNVRKISDIRLFLSHTIPAVVLRSSAEASHSFLSTTSSQRACCVMAATYPSRLHHGRVVVICPTIVHAAPRIGLKIRHSRGCTRQHISTRQHKSQSRARIG